MILNVPDNPKMLRETLCMAQVVLSAHTSSATRTETVERLQRLIDECDRHRPLGPDGKHGNRHTSTCGCEDKGNVGWIRIVEANQVFEHADNAAAYASCSHFTLTAANVYAILEGRQKNYSGWTFEWVGCDHSGSRRTRTSETLLG